MYFDPDIGQTVLFGGYSDDAEGADETWTFDYVNNTWNFLNISIKPRARYGSRMVYDPVNQRGVLFGGRIIGYYVLNDTWEFNLSNNSWTQLDLPEGPSARYWYSMAYDSYNQLIVLFGGSEGGSSVSQETWVFNVTSNHWLQMDPDVNPPNRSYHKCAFDSENGKVIMFGGTISGYSTPYNDTWTYEENNWIKHDPRVIEYSPVPGFNIPLVIIALFALSIFYKVKKRFN